MSLDADIPSRQTIESNNNSADSNESIGVILDSMGKEMDQWKIDALQRDGLDPNEWDVCEGVDKDTGKPGKFAFPKDWDDQFKVIG